MNFKQYVLDNANKKYSDMYDGASKNPIKVDTKLADYSTYDKKRLDYNNRLSQERRDYNNALESIIAVRAARVKREKDIAWQIAEKKKARQFAIKQIISTFGLLLPTLLLLLGGLFIVVNPIPVFKLINFWIVIVVYVVALVAVIIASVYIIKNYEYKDSLIMHKGKVKAVMLIVCGVLATFVMAFGMINVGNLTVEISSADDFILMKNLPGAGRCDYQLKNDIDCHGKTPDGWGAINEFSGTFDGNYHSITNIKYSYASTKKSNQSLGMVKNNCGTIKNLAIEDSVFDVTITCSDDATGAEFYFGVLAGKQGDYSNTDGVIDNCRIINVYADIDIYSDTEKYDEGRLYVGGCVGYNYGIIRNCEVYSDDYSKNEGSMIDVEFESKTNDKELYIFLAGITGGNYSGDVTSCIVDSLPLTALAIGDYNYVHVGGLIGDNDGTNEITNCILNVDCKAEANRDYFWEMLELGDADCYTGLLIGNQDFNQYNKITSRDNYIVRYEGVNIVGNKSGEDIAGINICTEADISLNTLPSSYSGWTISKNGHPTPCTGFDTN